MNYEFTGYDMAPRELFDQRRWADCLHATIQWYNHEGDVVASQDALQDTGIIHELTHLVCGIEINTHRSMAQLRSMVPDIKTDLPIH